MQFFLQLYEVFYAVFGFLYKRKTIFQANVPHRIFNMLHNDAKPTEFVAEKRIFVSVAAQRLVKTDALQKTFRYQKIKGNKGAIRV